jgi:PAS domain S-box-containing protein
MSKRAQPDKGLRWETAALAIAIAGAVGIGVTGYRTTQALATTAAEVDQTHRTIEALDEVINAVGAAGNARRSFLFGGEGADRERFETSSESARDAIARAGGFADTGAGGGDPNLEVHLDRVRALVEMRLSALEESMRRHQRGLGDDATEPPSRAETELVATLRAAVGEATSEPRRHLAEQEDRAVRIAAIAKEVDGVGTALSLVVLVLAFTSVRRDAARERAARRDADRASRFLDSLIENLPAMVFMKDAQSLRFERINRAGEELLGVSRAELLGKTDHDLFPDEQARFFEAEDRHTLASADVVDIAEEPVETKSGRRWLHTRKVPLFDGDGPPRYLLGISEDITARKASAEALEAAKDKAEAMSRELEAFSYSVAHDLRTPLRSIDGFSRALMEDSPGALDDVGRGHLLRVIAAAQRMAELIDDLLLLSRITRARMDLEDVDLSEIATASAASLRADARGREVRVDIASPLRTRGDPRLLRIVFDNLLGNAFKFTAGRPSARIEVGETLEEGRQAFFVRDDGAGFDNRYASKLFGAFQRLHDVRDYPGTGIGLATVQRIVSRHGGRVWAKGEIDKGATITFTLAGDTSNRPPVRTSEPPALSGRS